MGRAGLPVGTFGEVSTRKGADGRHRARARYRDVDGRYRQLEASGASAAEAKRRLRRKPALVDDTLQGSSEITGDTQFAVLVEYWRMELDSEGELAGSTRERYAWEATHLLFPAFELFVLREITVGRVERWLTQQRAFSYARGPLQEDPQPGHGCRREAGGGRPQPRDGHQTHQATTENSDGD